MLIIIVDDDKSRLSAHDFSQSNIIRALQLRIGRPMTKYFVHYGATKIIPNFP